MKLFARALAAVVFAASMLTASAAHAQQATRTPRLLYLPEQVVATARHAPRIELAIRRAEPIMSRAQHRTSFVRDIVRSTSIEGLR